MDFEEYSDFLNILAAIPLSKGKSFFDILGDSLIENKSITESAINFRYNLVGEFERNIASAYLSLGYFTEYDTDYRIACFCVAFDAEYKKDITILERDCCSYTSEQPLFSKEPKLLEHTKNQELIDYSVLNRIPNSEIISFKKIYGYLNTKIPLKLLDWIEKNLHDSPLYVRVNPWESFSTQPPQMIREEAIIQPNPKWWSNLKIYNRQHEGCSFQLRSDVPISKMQEYLDYHVPSIRRLDVIAKRNGNGNLSMMIEELEDRHNIIDPSEQYLIGRMIHLDTDAEINTPFTEAKLNHIDLAINVYEEDYCHNRMNDNLASGNHIEDATFRTHILRMENIPFTCVFQFACSFFKSQTLLNEWISSQFA